MKSIVPILMLMLLISCKKAETVQKRIISDSTLTKISMIPRTADVVVPGSTATLQLKLKADSAGLINLSPQESSSGSATVRVSVQDGVLKVQANCKEYEAKIDYLERQIEVYQSRQDQFTETVTVTKKKVPKWMWILSGCSVLFNLIALFILIIKT